MKMSPVTLTQEDRPTKQASAFFYKESENMLLVLLDLNKKGVVCGIGDNDLFVDHNDPYIPEYTLTTHEPMTQVHFDDIDEDVWSIHMAQVMKHTLSVLFLKKEE